MTEEELAEIEARANAATKGPWTHETVAQSVCLSPLPEGVEEFEVPLLDHEGNDLWPWGRMEDMAFAYAARADVPALLAKVRRLQAENAQLRELVRDAFAEAYNGWMMEGTTGRAESEHVWQESEARKALEGSD